LGGIGSFGVGHIAYIVGIVGFAGAAGLGDAGVLLAAWLAWLIVGAIGWYFAVWRGAKERGSLHRAALPYALLLASTAGAATGLALQNGLFFPLALGAALFLLSDLILAARLFRGAYFPLIDDVVWLTYGPAQLLIVYSVDAALRSI
jgi:hypothetical protein